MPGMKKPPGNTRQPPLYEAWFKCGCTKIAPRRDITEYCAIHGDDREALVKHTPFSQPPA
jgi:hypothetical protein